MDTKSKSFDVDRVTRLRHDVMNPLTVVIGYAKMLYKREDLSDEAREYARRIVVEAERCVEIFEMDKQAQSDPDRYREAGQSGKSGGDERSVRILVIDDDPGIRMLAHEVLRDGVSAVFQDTDVVCVTNRAQAMEKVGDVCFDAVVVDLNIERSGGGIELLARIEDQHPGISSRAIIMSGGVMDLVTQRMLERMSIPMLTKPFSISELLTSVLKILNAG